MTIEITSEVITQFRIAMPAFQGLTEWPDEVLIEVLGEADGITPQSRWGAYENDPRNHKRRGMFNYAAHLLATMYPNGACDATVVSAAAQNAVTSKSVGDESKSFAIRSADSMREGDEYFNTTRFGQAYLRARRTAACGAMVV